VSFITAKLRNCKFVYAYVPCACCLHLLQHATTLKLTMQLLKIPLHKMPSKKLSLQNCFTSVTAESHGGRSSCYQTRWHTHHNIPMGLARQVLPRMHVNTATHVDTANVLLLVLYTCTLFSRIRYLSQPNGACKMGTPTSPQACRHFHLLPLIL
jgi:hypothetical protein